MSVLRDQFSHICTSSGLLDLLTCQSLTASLYSTTRLQVGLLCGWMTPHIVCGGVCCALAWTNASQAPWRSEPHPQILCSPHGFHEVVLHDGGIEPLSFLTV